MNRKVSLLFRITLLLASVMAVAVAPAFAQEGQTGDYVVRVVQVDTSHFPQISVWVSVTDAQGNPVTLVPGSAFTLLENGQPVTITDISQSGEEIEGALNVVLTIDRSGSMNEGGKIDAARAAATAFVDLMRPGDQTGVIAYNTEVEVIQPLTGDQAALRQAIASIQGFEDTAMYDGLGASLDMLAGAQGRRVVILLSDGLDNSSVNYTANDIIASAGGSALSIYTIGLGDQSVGAGGGMAGIDEAALRNIAEQTNGTYTYAPSPDQLGALYQGLSYQLQSEYRLTYVTSNTLRDGIARGLEVQVAAVGGVQAGYNPGGVIPETAQVLGWPIFGGLLLGLIALLFLPGLLRGAGGAAKNLIPKRRRVKLTKGAASPRAPIVEAIKGKPPMGKPQQPRVRLGKGG